MSSKHKFPPKLWLRKIIDTTVTDFGKARWNDLAQEDLLYFEHMMASPGFSKHLLIKYSDRMGTLSKGSSEHYFYEACVRLLFAQTLAQGGEGKETYTIISEGMGEDFDWTK